MVKKFDTIVCGLGAMGSAAGYQLAKRGNKVLGLDRFSPPHDNGSSHGESRIIRQAIAEGDEYVPLVLRSYELWREIEKETGKKLLTITGGLTLESQNSEAVMHGRPDFLDQAIRCAGKFTIRHEIFETADIKNAFRSSPSPMSALISNMKRDFSGRSFVSRPNCSSRASTARLFKLTSPLSRSKAAPIPECRSRPPAAPTAPRR